VNAAAGRYADVDQDIEGQSRGTNSDVGADELSTKNIRYMPLTDQDVGPEAK
jgi:hypothetical protein